MRISRNERGFFLEWKELAPLPPTANLFYRVSSCALQILSNFQVNQSPCPEAVLWLTLGRIWTNLT